MGFPASHDLGHDGMDLAECWWVNDFWTPFLAYKNSNCVTSGEIGVYWTCLLDPFGVKLATT